MTAAPQLQRLSEADLDGLIAELRLQGTRELVLLGPNVDLPASVDQWAQELRDKPRIYQLLEPVEGLAERLGALTQLTSLNLWGNQIGAAGAASLAALTQLASLNLGRNDIGSAGAVSLFSLTKLTSFSLGDNPRSVKKGKPRIYTYFMQANITIDKRLQKDLNSRWDFEEKLKNLGHYPTYYTSIEDLKLQFQQQLNTLIEAG